MPQLMPERLLHVPLFVPGLAILATLAFAWFAGQEMSWDVVNHHYYIPFAWMQERVTTDYFGAGPQSYQNPIGYLVFYAMVQAGLPQWLIGLLLALIHAGCAIAAWSISRSLWKDLPNSLNWILLATAAAWLTPVYLQAVGTSSNDLIGAVLALAALAILISPGLHGRTSAAASAGLLLGLSVGIKLSNAPWVIACGVIALVQVVQKRQPPRMLAVWSIAGGAGMLAGGGWSAIVLWQEFGNPIFPFYNDIFQSPLGPDTAFSATRFIPQSYEALLARPLEMALPKAYVYSENFAPDLRPIALLAAGVLLMTSLAVRRWRHTNPQVATGDARRWRPSDTDLTLFACVGTVFWLATSGNGRYAVVLLMVVGILLVRWLWIALPSRPARTLALLLLCLQAAVFWQSADHHRNSEPWTAGPFYRVELSDRLRTTPALHLTLGIQSHASIAAIAFAPSGALANPIGQYSLPYDGTRGAPLRSLLAQWRGRTRVLIKEPPVEYLAWNQQVYDELINRLGMSVDWTDCEPVRLLRTSSRVELWSCGVIQPSRIDAPWLREQLVADRAFDVLERACPDLYAPRPVVTERIEGAWRRFYANSDTHVLIAPSVGVITMHGRNMRMRRAGSLEEVASGRGAIDCTPWTWATPN